MNDDIEQLFIDDAYIRKGIMVDPIVVSPKEDPSFMDTYAAAVTEPLADVTKATPDAYKKMAGATAKGGVQALGTPMDIVGLLGGLLNMASPDPEGKGNLAQFEEIYGAIPFTSEDIKGMLEDAGWKYEEGPEQAAELIGEVGPVTEVVAKGVKKIIKKKAK